MNKTHFVLVGLIVIGMAMVVSGCAKVPSILSCNVTPEPKVLDIIKLNNQYILSESGVCVCDQVTFRNSTGDHIRLTVQASGYGKASAELDPGQSYGPIPNKYREITQATLEIFGSAGKFQRTISTRCTTL